MINSRKLEKTKDAISKTIKDNPELLEVDCHEVAITGKIMCGLTRLFRSWDVDMEYNRLENSIKRRNSGSLVRPDIIVHKRKKSGRANNLLIIEVKKSANANEKYADIEILKEMTSPDGEYAYQFGVFVNIIHSTLIQFNFVNDGHVIDAA